MRASAFGCVTMSFTWRMRLKLLLGVRMRMEHTTYLDVLPTKCSSDASIKFLWPWESGADPVETIEPIPHWEVVDDIDDVTHHLRWSQPDAGGDYLYVGKYTERARADADADTWNREGRSPDAFRPRQYQVKS